MHMNAYIYRAALYCEDCAEAIKQRLRSSNASESKSSDDYPQGPYSAGGGEADCPQHCDSCRKFLENPLTSDGVDYIKHVLSYPDKGAADVLETWREFYKNELN